jgi:porin
MYVVLTVLLALANPPLRAAPLGEDFRVDLIATGVYQLGDYEDAVDTDDNPLHQEAKGTVAVDGAVEYTPSDRDTFYSLLSWARGNGLKGLGGVSLDVNSDDLEDDVKNINGRNRDYLLEAWYRRDVALSESARLSLSGGLIDATRYIDQNDLSNDEITQFMNSAFVSRFFLPSYDPGVALELVASDWQAHAVWMHTRTGPKSDGGIDYDFLGVDVGLRTRLPFGEGHYNLILETSSKDFDNRDGSGQTRRSGFGISASQSIGDAFGIFVRAGHTNGDVAGTVHDTLVSGGIQLDLSPQVASEMIWGIAAGHLEGAGNKAGEVRATRVFESYVRLGLNRFSDISLDVQYVRDDVRDTPNPQVWVLGARLNGYY